MENNIKTHVIIGLLSRKSPLISVVGISFSRRWFSVSLPSLDRVRFSEKGRRGLDDNSKSFSALIEKAIKRINGMVSRNGGRPLIGFLIRNLGWVGGRLSRSRCAMVVAFVRMCHSLHKHEGMKGLVLYLKTSYVLLQQCTAGYIVDDLGPLKRRVRRDRSGIPLWIPRLQRNLIRKQDIKTIRFWTSLVSLYRILHFPAPVSVDSIIKPGVDWLSRIGVNNPYRDGFEQAITLFWHHVGGSGLKKMYESSYLDFFSILKSSPLTSSVWDPDLMVKNDKSIPADPGSHFVKAKRGVLVGVPIISTHPKSVNQAAYTIMGSDLRDSFMVFASKLKGFFEFFSNLRRCSMISDPPLDYVGTPYTTSLRTLPLGKLGLKDEPAGKVRVFAMVDCWTQWLLFPLHTVLQQALRKISEDATFDQIGVMEKKLDSLSLKYKKGKAFSFDLSSATDRLPVGLQVSVLTPLLGLYESKAWASILVDRDYVLPARAERDTNRTSVRYAVGQPMGAYSSWVMLAVTHHVIIQWAAWVVGKIPYTRWFSDYVVLGDDVVIFDPLVAGCYHHIMTNILGVSIGLAKSIKSHCGFVLEFAKKFWVNGKRCFVVPLRDCIVSNLSTDTLMEFINKHQMTLNDYLRIRGLGYKSRSKYRADLWRMPTRLRVYMVVWAYYSKPFMDWVTMKSINSNFPITFEGMYEFIETLHELRKELILRLERRKHPVASDFEKLSLFPFYRSTKALEEMTEVIEYNQLLSRMRFKGIPDLTLFDRDQLRVLFWGILEDIEHLEARMEKLPDNSWIRWQRVEDRPFNTISDLYRKWCRLNNCFGKHYRTGREWTDVSLPVTKDNGLPEGYSIFVAPYMSEDFFSWRFTPTAYRRTWTIASYLYSLLFGGVVMWLVLDWLSNRISFPSLYHEVIESGVSTDDAPTPPNDLHKVWWAVLIGFFGSFLFLLLLGLVFPPDEMIGLWNLFSEMLHYKYEPAPDITYPDYGPNFRFPSLQELIDWPNPRFARPDLGASPQIAHGWSEPWPYNADWPDQFR